MKLSTTLDQLLRLVLVPEDGQDDEKGSRPDPLPAASVSPPREPVTPAPVPEPEEPWRAQYTPPAERVDDSSEPREARFAPEAPQSAPPEPEPVAAPEPERTPEPEARFTPPEPAVPQPVEAEPATAPVLPPQPRVSTELEHRPAGERGRLEQLEAAVSVAESLNLGLHLGLAVERISVAATQGSEGAGTLREAAWLIERYIALLEKRPIGADLHQSGARLARTGDAIQELKELASAFPHDPDPDEPGRIRRLSS